MSTREALTALVHHIFVSRAHQVRMGLPVREAAVEEVGPWPGRNEYGPYTDHLRLQKFIFGVSDPSNPRYLLVK